MSRLPNPVTPKESARRTKAIKAAGYNVRQASRDLGISQATLNRWWHREQGTTPGGDVSTKPPKAPKVEKAVSDEIKRLTAERDQAVEQLQATRAAKVDIIRPGKVRAKLKGDITRVIIPDSHGSHIDRAAAAAFLADLKRLDPDEVIMLGDHLDCGGFLAQHHTLGFVAETLSTFADDVAACNQFLDQIQAAAPRAHVTYLQGNHCERLEKFCITATLRNHADAQFMLDLYGPQAVLHLKQRGIEFIHSGTFYDGLTMRGAIKRGLCLFTHGYAFGKMATLDHVRQLGISCVHGHSHRSQSAVIKTVGAGTIGGWCPGTLAQLQPYYKHTAPTEHTHGYGIQYQARSQKFLTLNVPIVNGESLLFGVIDGK